MAKTPEQKAYEFLKSVFDQIPKFIYERVENEVSTSTPDISYAYNGHNGWIELKSIPALGLPVNLGKKFAIPHFTEGQKKWLKTRGAIAGSCWLLVVSERKEKSRNHMLMIRHDQLDLVGKTWGEVLNQANGVWVDEVDPLAVAERLGGAE